MAGDALSRKWMHRNQFPYRGDIEHLATDLGSAGAYLLNVSYEWACTTGIHQTIGAPPIMMRVLDWDPPALGRTISVIRQSGQAGDWFNIAWPGFVGALTALAAGRFAAAINKPPLPPSITGRGLAPLFPQAATAADWLASRPGRWRSDAMPPAHLLHQVCEEVRDWDQALDRQTQMEALLTSGRDPWNLTWLQPPILNPTTRVVAVAHPATGRLTVQGWEATGAATHMLELTG